MILLHEIFNNIGVAFMQFWGKGLVIDISERFVMNLLYCASKIFVVLVSVFGGKGI
jgi:hypothetical protein